MLKFSEVEIKTEFPVTKVSVDGNEIHGVQSVDFHVGVDGLPTVRINAIAKKVTVDGKAIVVPGLDSLVNQGVECIKAEK